MKNFGPQFALSLIRETDKQVINMQSEKCCDTIKKGFGDFWEQIVTKKILL